MYWSGKVGGPDGENFSFYVEWVSTEDRFSAQGDGFSIVIKPASGPIRIWVTRETMRSLAEHDPSLIRIDVKAMRAEVQLERKASQLDWDGNPLEGPKEDYVQMLKKL